MRAEMRVEQVLLVRGLEAGNFVLAVLLEADRELHSTAQRIQITAHHVCGNAKVRLLGELDNRNHIRRRNVGMERLVIHGVREERRTPADGFRCQGSAAFGAICPRRVDPTHARVAVLDPELAARSARPECAIDLGEFREDARYGRRRRLMHRVQHSRNIPKRRTRPQLGVERDDE